MSIPPKKNKEESNISNEIRAIEKELNTINPDLFKGVKETQKQQILQSITFFKSHSGPLPSPEDLHSYNEIIPNGGERLMRQVELQSEHRRKLEGNHLTYNTLQSIIGQLFGLVISGAFVYIAYLLAMNGHDWVAGVLGGSTLIGLVSIFVIGRKRQNQ